MAAGRTARVAVCAGTSYTDADIGQALVQGVGIDAAVRQAESGGLGWSTARSFRLLQDYFTVSPEVWTTSRLSGAPDRTTGSVLTGPLACVLIGVTTYFCHLRSASVSTLSP